MVKHKHIILIIILIVVVVIFIINRNSIISIIEFGFCHSVDGSVLHYRLQDSGIKSQCYSSVDL